MYAEIVARIREKTDILIDSTLGLITVKEDENRLAHVREMGRAVGRSIATTDEARAMLGSRSGWRAVRMTVYRASPGGASPALE